jgi:hypothetical protein
MQIEKELLENSKQGIMCISKLDPGKALRGWEIVPRWNFVIVYPFKFWIKWDL